MKKITKKEWGLIASIVELSDGNKKTKDEMAFNIANYGLDKSNKGYLDNLIAEQKIFTTSVLSDRHIGKTTSQDFDPSDYLGKGLRSAEEKEIIKRDIGPKREGKRGSRGNRWYLIKNHKTLYKIYRSFRHIGIEEGYKKQIQYSLFKSEFYQKMLNKELVYKLNRIHEEEDWMNSKKDLFTDSELKLILKIIKMSPSALNIILELIYHSEVRKFFVAPSLPEFTLNKVIFSFLDDFRYEWYENTCPINCKIQFSIDEPLKEREYTERTEMTSYDDGKITHEIKMKVYKKDKWGNKVD